MNCVVSFCTRRFEWIYKLVTNRVLQLCKRAVCRREFSKHMNYTNNMDPFVCTYDVNCSYLFSIEIHRSIAVFRSNRSMTTKSIDFFDLDGKFSISTVYRTCTNHISAVQSFSTVIHIHRTSGYIDQTRFIPIRMHVCLPLKSSI
jgi:hypothetical protein